MFQANLGSSLVVRPVPPSSSIRQYHCVQMPSTRRESVEFTGQTPTQTPLLDMVIGNGHKNDLPRPNQTTIRQHHRMQMPSMHRESVKPTGHTPTHTTLMVIGNGHNNDLTTPNQITIRQHHRVQQMPSINRESVKPTGQTHSLMVIGKGNTNGLTRPNQTTQARILTTTERPHWEMNKSPVLILPPLAGTAAFKAHNPRLVTARAPLRHPPPAAASLPQPVTRRIAPVNRSSVGKPASAEKQSPVRLIQKNSGSKKKQPCKDQPQKPVRLLTVADFPPVSESVRAVMCRIADQQHSERQRAAVTGSVPR